MPPEHEFIDLTGITNGDLFKWDAADGEMKRLVPGAHINDVAGGAVVDAESRAAIALILDRLEAAHIVAP